MSVSADVSTDAIVVDAVEEASAELDTIFQGRDGLYYHYPSSLEGDSPTLNPIFNGRDRVYHTPA
jgi:hypothetical protein